MNRVTGNGGYKLGVKVLITKIKLRKYNDNQREVRERNQRENKNDCTGLLLGFAVNPYP